MNGSLRLVVLALATSALFPSTGAAKLADEDVAIVEAGDLASWDYSPSTLNVAAGTTVVWRNSGSQAHTVTSQDQLFDSRLLDANRSWTYTFNTPGTYRYFCVPHPWMKGVIVVSRGDDRDNRGRSDDDSDRDDDRDRRGEDDDSRDVDRSSGREQVTRSATATPTSSSGPASTPTSSPSPTPTATSGSVAPSISLPFLP
jgi:plastocyanin